MKKIMRDLLAVLSVAAISTQATAQVVTQNVGIGTLTPDVSARLDIVATNRGLLIPRVALLNVKDKTTVPTPATGLLVYNTNAGLAGGTGFFYNSGTTINAQWTKLLDGSSGSGWDLLGNAGTDSTVNFLGTTDNSPIMLRVNNKHAGFIGAAGGIAIGRGANGKNLLSTPGVIAIGDSALYNNIDSNQIAIGNNTLYSNTTGSSNTAIGNVSLVSNTIGYQNVAVGDFTLQLSDTSDNTAVGFAALNVTVGYENTGVGSQVLVNNFAGVYNTSLGYASSASNDNGSGNTSIGHSSLISNVSGNVNTAVGLYSLYYLEGDENTAVGYNAIGNTEGATGFSNSAFGADALTNLTAGNYNTAIGDTAAYVLTTGNFNTALGYKATVVSGFLNNTTVIGNGATVSGNNSIRVGNAAVTSIGGQVGWSTLSDSRYKRNVNNNVKGLDFIMKLNPVTYNYDFNKINTEIYNKNAPAITSNNSTNRNFSFRRDMVRGQKEKPSGLRTFSFEKRLGIAGKTGVGINHDAASELEKYNQEVAQNNEARYTGFIAQEVEAAAKKSGFEFSGIDKPKNANDQYGLRYAEFVVPLVKAMQEQQVIIDAQNKKITDLELRLRRLEQPAQ